MRREIIWNEEFSEIYGYGTFTLLYYKLPLEILANYIAGGNNFMLNIYYGIQVCRLRENVE